MGVSENKHPRKIEVRNRSSPKARSRTQGEDRPRWTMALIVEFIRTVNWESPGAVIVVALLTILSILRKWYLVTTLLLVVTLGRGLGYLHLNRELLGSNLTAATLIYLVGAVVMIVFAVVEFFVRE
jgi:hypothetical protein